MGESALVIASHVVIISLYALVLVTWTGFLMRKWREVLTNQIGLLLVGFLALAWQFAFESVYYGAGRFLKPMGYDLWDGAGAGIFIGASRSIVIGGALVCAVVAYWRTQNMPDAAICTRLATMMAVSIIVFTSVSVALW